MPLAVEPSDVRIVAADHPSLDAAVARFADEIRAERRYFGRIGGAPKPFPSLIARVCSREPGFRIAALHGGRVIGLARVDDRGEVDMVVAAPARGRGHGLALARAIVERARADGRTRLVLRSSRRSQAALAIGRAIGFVAVDVGQGRIDLILDLDGGVERVGAAAPTLVIRPAGAPRRRPRSSLGGG